jgi:hypothetical protein
VPKYSVALLPTRCPPIGAPVPSERIVWSTNIRHPTVWVAKRSQGFAKMHVGANFLLQCWLNLGSEWAHADYCRVAAIVNDTEQSPHKQRCEEYARANGQRRSTADVTRAPLLTRHDLERAKVIARGMAIIIDVDAYATDATLYCRLLHWPDPACNPSVHAPGGERELSRHHAAYA